MKTKLPAAAWLTIILFGFIGQLAWNIENMEFNLFLFNYIGGTTADIAAMVAWSAVVSTITTLLMGIVTDRLGKRKLFLCGGYIIWGFMTLLFAFISRDNTARIFPGLTAAEILARTSFMVILMDCIMSFFGSVANDASFNAWVTESTDETNRGTVEGVLNVFPLLAMLVVAGASGVIVDAIGWPMFFVVMGGLVSLCGLLGLLFVKEPNHQAAPEMKFLDSVVYGFRPSIIKENGKFYIALLGLCLFNISVQIFMPYLLIYLQNTLGFETLTYSLVMAVVIVLASVFSILIGQFSDSLGKEKFAVISVALFAAGLLLASFMKTPLAFTAAGTVMMCGFVAISVIFLSAVRDYTPAEHVGMFQGIRLLAYVLIPMIIGPNIGNAIIERMSNGTYVNAYGELVRLPVSAVFVAAALMSLTVLIPCFILFGKKRSSAD